MLLIGCWVSNEILTNVCKPVAMGKAISLLMFGAASLGFAGQAWAETICAPRAVVLSVFAEAYGTFVVESKHRQQSTTVEILHAAGTETWAVMGKNYRGETCITVRQSNKIPKPVLAS